MAEVRNNGNENENELAERTVFGAPPMTPPESLEPSLSYDTDDDDGDDEEKTKKSWTETNSRDVAILLYGIEQPDISNLESWQNLIYERLDLFGWRSEHQHLIRLRSRFVVLAERQYLKTAQLTELYETELQIAMLMFVGRQAERMKCKIECESVRRGLWQE